MTERLQTWILANTKGLQYLVNERLAARGGPIGQIATWLTIGRRQMGRHGAPKVIKLANWWWLAVQQLVSQQRMVFGRFAGLQNAPLNYSGLFVWFFATNMVFANFRFIRARDVLSFNQQDQPEFWFARYNLMFPPSFLQSRLSAHYIEINHIYGVEMMKRYVAARKEIIDEREAASPEERLTRYASNSGYVYEPLGEDAPAIKRAKDLGYM